jgi:RHS repeat-associated protein
MRGQVSTINKRSNNIQYTLSEVRGQVSTITTQYTYNNNNILTSITHPTGRTITYTPDQIGRISQVSTMLNGNPKTLASAITYLPYGGITGLTYGNGLTLTQGYDDQYRISSILTASIINLTFGYDPNGNITSIIDTVNPPGGEVFDPPGTYTYQTETNKLIHIEGTPSIDFGYDANANITSKNTWTYIYDLSNQLIRVLDNSNQVAEYTYNGAGQRIKKVTPTETTIFHYDLLGHLIAETNQAGQMLAEYIYLGDQLLAMIKPGEAVYYYHNDHLGTPQVLTDDTQTIVWKAVYTPFGNAVASIQTIENPFRFPGQYYDSETGLHYNYFRYYNPQTGRYINPDPIGLEGGINLFAYVVNPINWIDPEGLVRKPGKTPPKLWPSLPTDLGGKKPRWNPEGYWEGKNHKRLTWDDRSHGSGIDRGKGKQGGHWDDEKTGEHWDEKGNPLPGNESKFCNLPQSDWWDNYANWWEKYGPQIVGGSLILAGGILIVGDIILGGPTGEGIIPGMILIRRGTLVFAY